jgi:hypothetical protein
MRRQMGEIHDALALARQEHTSAPVDQNSGCALAAAQELLAEIRLSAVDQSQDRRTLPEQTPARRVLAFPGVCAAPRATITPIPFGLQRRGDVPPPDFASIALLLWSAGGLLESNVTGWRPKCPENVAF